MRTRYLRGLVFAGAAFLAVRPVTAGTMTGGAGVDYETGPEAQSYRSALLFGSADLASGDFTVAAVRFGDSSVGPGISGFANAGPRITSASRLRVIGLRTIGDRAYRAWRVRAGPELNLTSEVTLGAYYLRAQDNSAGNFDAGGVELSVPIARGVSGQVGSSYGKWDGGATTAQGMMAGTWHAGSRVQFLCEVDVGRNVMTTSSSAPSGGGILGGLPITGGLGNGGSVTESRTENRVTATSQFGVRFLFP
ncbi:MAG: hypothetical protein E6K77_02025 [Candidatus Eisenbacteria bacterium]|uniref:Porin family protein n=1 Tax=Eiseniibacteriota bacterium TaxID=2212470 RepID=A0A538SR87_UNCEI|nr:MAG: hypothetical protein E6K74_08235 [Candidatus Eisenbacteria bacterium]TMQ65829.1 MAG: hypothetical protein E6K77_02025 [Candidatus Eisenbacteria bacterium]